MSNSLYQISQIRLMMSPNPHDDKDLQPPVVFFSLTWWVSTDVAGVSVWNIVFQQAHACAMLPAQTVFTLRERQVLVKP